LRGAGVLHDARIRAVVDFLQDGRCGVARRYRNGDHAAACGLYFLAPDDLIAGPIAALHEYVRKKRRDNFARRGLIEDDHRVDAFERRQNFRALAFRQNWTTRAFQFADAAITVETDDQGVAKLPCRFERANVSGVQEVETAIGENHALASGPLRYVCDDRWSGGAILGEEGFVFIVVFGAAKPQNRLFQRKNS